MGSFGLRTTVLVILALTLAGCAAAPSRVLVGAPHAPAADPSAPAPLATSTGAGAASGTTLQLVASASAPGGYALRLHEDRAYVATFSTLEGISVFDVSDPEAPVHLGGTPPGVLARSVDILDYGARTVVAISTGTELEAWDLTDPDAPARLARFRFGSHNVAVHPDAKVIYNARNVWDGVGGAMEILDASDPDHITLHHTMTFPPSARDGSLVHNQACHDFVVTPHNARMYCAAYEQSLIFDITDPLQPVILTAINNPLVTSHHTAFPILHDTVLVVSDEFADNLMWGCLSHQTGVAPEAPVGGLWFYDLTTPTPEVLGYVAGPRRLPSEAWFLTDHGINAMCGSHNGAEVGAGTGLIAYGWFDAGLALIDASDPRNAKLLDAKDVAGAYGDARAYGGHIFAADDEVGLTVFKLV